ncbi:hypothetical protein TruAng_008575 [Truncatella angustata]|nr:hypothetical protein TruAng_008575 [Truncatella angustata]
MSAIWRKLPPKAAYLTVDNPASRNALSLPVLRNLRSQLHKYNTSPADGKIYTLPPFNPNILSSLEKASTQPWSHTKHAWLLHTAEWYRHRRDLPTVLVLRSIPGFSSGNELKELSRLSHDEVSETFTLFAEVMTLIRRSPAPVVCAVEGGRAAAAGAQLALTCDLPIAFAGTRFQLPGQRIGLPGTLPATAVSRRLGPAFGYRMSALAEGVRADELPGGVVETVPDGDDYALKKRVEGVVSQLVEVGGRPQALGKWAYWTQLEAHRWTGDADRWTEDGEIEDEADGYEKALRWAGRMMALHARTDDAQKGMAAFGQEGARVEHVLNKKIW